MHIENQGIYRQSWAEINIPHLVHNYKTLRALVDSEAFFCPMLKADAYGHGAGSVLQALLKEGQRQFGVALVEEGIELRQAVPANLSKGLEILAFATFNESGVQALIQNQLIPVISEWGQLELMLRGAPPGARYPIHIKFDTGMHRMGFQPQDAEKIREHLRRTDQLRLQGVCTHLSDGDDFAQSQGRSQSQIKKFQDLLPVFASFQPQVHILNSSALLAHWIGSEGQLSPWGARPGLALYGVWPDGTAGSDQVSLLPVMSVKSHLVQIHSLEAGERVSYGGRWVAPEPSWVGVVALGYGDGYPRGLSNRAVMLVRGQEVPVIGSVCMDYTMVDLTGVVTATGSLAVGEEVLILGQQGSAGITAERLASLNQSISYEILTAFGLRMPRVFIF